MHAANALRSMQLLRRSILDKGTSKEISRIALQGYRYNSTIKESTDSNKSSATSADPAISSPASAADDDEPLKKVVPKVDYKTDYGVARRYTDVNIMKIDGRVYATSSVLISAETAEVFPTIYGSNMFGVDRKVPLCSEADAKVVCFSVKEYGFQLVRAWMDPFARRYNPDRNSSTENTSTTTTENSVVPSSEQFREPASEATCSRVSCQEVIFVEYSFLWFLRSVFANSSKPKLLPQQHEHTYLAFGSVKVCTCAALSFRLILYCIVLHCAVLYRDALYCTVLCRTLLSCP
jgi:hypothetical protein